MRKQPLTSLQQELDRRNLLRYLGFSALGFSFYRVLREEQLFGATPAKRAVFFYFPDGIIKEQFHPSGTGSNFSFPAMTAPLEKVKSDLIAIKGVRYGAEGSHEGGAAYCLSGKKSQTGDLTIDNYLGEKLKADVPFPTVKLGVAANFQPNRPISYLAPGSGSPIEDDPAKALRDIFGSPQRASLRLQNSDSSEQSLLDFCIEDISSLKRRLGPIETRKLDMHLEALRELERRSQSVQSSGKQAAMCKNEIDMRGQKFPEQDVNYPKTIHKNEAFGVVGDIMIDILVHALACGVTNVGLLQWSHPVSPTNFDFPGGIGIARGHHDISHYGSNNAQEFVEAQSWYMTRLATMIERLKSVQEGDQTLLFNTVVMGFTEIADGNLHDFENAGVVLAGQAGGHWATGKCIDAAGASHNQILVSILQACGQPDNTFGDPSLGMGALPGILA